MVPIDPHVYRQQLLLVLFFCGPITFIHICIISRFSLQYRVSKGVGVEVVLQFVQSFNWITFPRICLDGIHEKGSDPFKAPPSSVRLKMNVCLSGGGEECALFVHCIGWKISLVIDYFQNVVVPEFVLIHPTPHKAQLDTHQPYVHIIRGCTLFGYTVTIVVLLLCYFCPWSSFLVSSSLFTWKFNLILCHRIFPIPVTSFSSKNVLSGVSHSVQNHWLRIRFHQLHFSLYLFLGIILQGIESALEANNDQGSGNNITKHHYVLKWT